MEQLGGLAVGIVALAIILTIAFLVLSEGKEQAVGMIDTTSFANSTKTIANGTDFIFRDCIDDEVMAVTQLYNGSGADTVLLTSDNYTIATNVLTLNSIHPSTASKNVSYSCKVRDEAYNSTETLQNATNDVPGWIPIVVITFIGAILLSLVARFRRK